MSKKPLVSGAENVLNKFKMEVAQELGIEDQITEYGYKEKNINNNNSIAQGITESVKKGGNIGGEMVRKMIKHVEEKMSDEYNS